MMCAASTGRRSIMNPGAGELAVNVAVVAMPAARALMMRRSTPPDYARRAALLTVGITFVAGVVDDEANLREMPSPPDRCRAATST